VTSATSTATSWTRERPVAYTAKAGSSATRFAVVVGDRRPCRPPRSAPAGGPPRPASAVSSVTANIPDTGASIGSGAPTRTYRSRGPSHPRRGRPAAAGPGPGWTTQPARPGHRPSPPASAPWSFVWPPPAPPGDTDGSMASSPASATKSGASTVWKSSPAPAACRSGRPRHRPGVRAGPALRTTGARRKTVETGDEFRNGSRVLLGEGEPRRGRGGTLGEQCAPTPVTPRAERRPCRRSRRRIHTCRRGALDTSPRLLPATGCAGTRARA